MPISKIGKLWDGGSNFVIHTSRIHVDSREWGQGVVTNAGLDFIGPTAVSYHFILPYGAVAWLQLMVIGLQQLPHIQRIVGGGGETLMLALE